MLGLFFAALIGLALGTLGGGGSILTVPVLVYVLGYDPKLAIAMSLPVVGTAAFIGVISHWRAGNVRLKTAALFGSVAMIGSYAGARGSVLLSARLQLLILGTVMIAAALSMLRSALQDGSTAPAAERPPHPGILLSVGFAVGLLTGVIGIGGGFLIVPALVILGRVPMRAAVGTSLLVISMNSASGYLGHLGHQVIPWDFVIRFTAVAVVGILGGTAITRHLSTQQLKRAFAVLLVVIGVLILWQNRTQL